MNEILEEIRAAYEPWGIDLEGVATYGTYYRLRCAKCGSPLGAVGDKLLAGMAKSLLDDQFELYAVGLLGCKCGHQIERAKLLDAARSASARKSFVEH
jgi:hypothetical protein